MNKKVDDAFNTMCDAIREYKQTIKVEMAALDKELPLDNGYGEEDEPLVINVVDDNGCGVDTFELDKSRVDAHTGEVQFHARRINDVITDEWVNGYMLGSDETYAMENIIF